MKKSGFFGGLIAVLIISVLVFFIIFLFMPEVSMKFFRFSNDTDYVAPIKEVKEKAEEVTLKSDADVNSEINEFLSSADGKEVVESIQNAAVKAGKTVSEYMKSDEASEFLNSAKNYVKRGVGSAKDFFQGEGKEFIEGLKN